MENVRGSEWHKWDLHIHTASSYDSEYKGQDADELLCSSLQKNDIKAVAITDHFLIDKDRIQSLRKKAPNITFFPGVELRTDKGANNLHLIIIFSDKIDLDTLATDFEVIMYRDKAKANDSEDTIYWSFDDIVQFARKHDGLISIHAGKKTNGIDKEISNAIPVKEAIKAEIADNIDFFEVGNIKDVETYQNIVFKEIDEKPIIICSDCHDPREYSVKESLWIKANLTFEGLKQCIYQPQERVFVGTVPPALDRIQKHERENINSISVHRIEGVKNKQYKWFDFELPLNSGLVAVIGNKGSGKSAFSDIIGQLCKCKTMNNASFLNTTRFRKLPKNYAADYIATIEWRDGHKEEINLADEEYDSVIEDAQYLPQKYIEDVCNDIGDIFQKEIDKVIFSYVDDTERGNAKNLSELVVNKSQIVNLEVLKITNEIKEINDIIIKLEEKKTSHYKTFINDSCKKMKQNLERHNKAKPKEIAKPEVKEEDNEYQKKLNEINKKISTISEDIENNRQELTRINRIIDEARQILTKINLLESSVCETQAIVDDFFEKYSLDTSEKKILLSTPQKTIDNYIQKLMEEKLKIQKYLYGDEESIGIINEINQRREEKDVLISGANSEEKQYQKYLKDLAEWENESKKIIGTEDTENTLSYYEKERKYIETQLDKEYDAIRERRDQKFKELFEQKEKLVSVYEGIYNPIEGEVKKLLGEIEDNIDFEAEIRCIHFNFAETVLSLISQKYAGFFKGKTQAHDKMDKLIKKTEFNRADSVLELVHNILVAVDEDIDNSEKKILDKNILYNYLYSQEYLGVSFKLKMGKRDLEELSPGERGIVLLIFYLALSKNNAPIIIDQPEDNLDNQSVYSKLVPCICAAKKKRQVIIVTHNPNIAVACDAEQIIYCKMDKDNYQIKYIAGAIEDKVLKNHVIDVLEGTMPAFDLRKRKYI